MIQIFELVDKDWVCLYTFSRADSVHGVGIVQESPVSAIRWHPVLAHDMLVGFCNGSAHVLSFLHQSGEVSLPHHTSSTMLPINDRTLAKPEP